MSGQLGWDLIMDYIWLLQTFPKLGVSQLALDFFKVAVRAMGDHWKRFCHATVGFPANIFKLVDMDENDFFLEYKRLQQQANLCNGCVDVEFSRVVLDWIAPDSQLNGPGVKSAIADLQNFLADVATIGPLSTDLVECYHGYTQTSLHRWRGTRVTDNVAQERVLWHAICGAYSRFKDWVKSLYLDKHFFRRLSMFGSQSRNQHERKHDSKGKPRSRLTLEGMDRMMACGQSLSKLRRLSGSLPEIFNWFRQCFFWCGCYLQNSHSFPTIMVDPLLIDHWYHI